jgi:hypothetical protein
MPASRMTFPARNDYNEISQYVATDHTSKMFKPKSLIRPPQVTSIMTARVLSVIPRGLANAHPIAHASNSIRSGFTLMVLAWTIVWFSPIYVCAQPTLSLVKSATTSAAADSVVVGSAGYFLDLRVNTGGNAVSGLQFHIETTPVETVIYGATPLSVLSNPFQALDVVTAPSTGAIVRQSGGTTVFFKGSGGDYPAFADNAIATYRLNTQSLLPGTYVFRAIGGELTNANTTLTSFGATGAFSLTILADADQDGMPDAFEAANNLNPNSSADAPKDDDGDGATNLEEYLAGTNPRNPASVLRTSIQRTGGLVQISFPATENKVYQIEFKNDLLPTTPWAALGPKISRADNGMLLGSDQIAINIPKRFYRVRVLR